MQNIDTPLQSFINHKANTSMQCGNYSIDIPELKEGEQYRFHFDAVACVGCHCCEVACNEQNGNSADVKWRRVGEMEFGEFPNSSTLFNSMSCNHCIDPACLNGCPTESYTKLDNGIVWHDDDTCIGCQYCTWNCPYEVPSFNKALGIVTKCHMCHEKLAVGQTPACVQACPSGAIEIEVVHKDEWIKNDMAKEGVAPHLPDISITKPTTRYTLPKILDSVKPADEHLVKPNHAEWPLVFMTVFTQISLGAFLIIVLGNIVNFLGFNLPNASFSMVFLALIPAAIGLPLSALHLGRPRLAITAMKNYKKSWLSREAIALGAYAGLVSILVVLYFFDLNGGVFVSVLELITLGVGIYGIYSQSMIYRIKARPSWNLKNTTDTFFATGYIGGFLIALVLVINGYFQSATIVIALSIFASYNQYFNFKAKIDLYKNLKENDEHFYQLNKTKKLYNGIFKKYVEFRKVLLICGAFAFGILSLLYSASGDETLSITALVLAIVTSTIGEIIDRSLFYKTAVAYGLAGNFFAGNQR